MTPTETSPEQRENEMRLFCDCKTDEEKSNFLLSGRAVETGVIAPAISNDVAMAYHRCAQFKKENDALRAKIEAMERQEPVGVLHVGSYYGEELQDWEFDANQCACDKLNEAYVSNPTSLPLYALPGAQGVPSVPSVPEANP